MCLDTSHTSIAQRKNLATFSRIIYALDTILLVILLLVGCVYGAVCYTVSEVITLDKTQFGAIIAENRKRQELTQQMLAQKLHVTDKAVSKWERGLSYPDVTLLQPLAAALGLQVDDLLSCRAAEKENDMTTSPIPHPSPVETVLTITAENRRRQRKRLLFAAAAVFLAVTVLVVLACSHDYLTTRVDPVPNSTITLTFYRDRLLGGTVHVDANEPFYLEGIPCEHCGKGPALLATHLPLTDNPKVLDHNPFSPDERYLLLIGKLRGGDYYLRLWDMKTYSKEDPVSQRDIAKEVLLTISDDCTSDTTNTLSLPALPLDASLLPCVELDHATWMAENNLRLSFSYNGTDGVRYSGTLIYNVDDCVLVAVELNSN